MILILNGLGGSHISNLFFVEKHFVIPIFHPSVVVLSCGMSHKQMNIYLYVPHVQWESKFSMCNKIVKVVFTLTPTRFFFWIFWIFRYFSSNLIFEHFFLAYFRCNCKLIMKSLFFPFNFQNSVEVWIIFTPTYRSTCKRRKGQKGRLWRRLQ